MTSDSTSNAASTAPADQLDAGNYEVIRQRLEALGSELGAKADGLNTSRKELFGGTELTISGNARIRTENNCVPRDIVNAGGLLFFAYNVFIGLKTETKLSDVFSLQRIAETEEGFNLENADPAELPGFLDNENFRREFAELYEYYKDARLVQLRTRDSKLLAVFQIGKSLKDVRVFRWSLDSDLRPTYIDSRGERDHVFPPSHDFKWTLCRREQHVPGRHPHVAILDEVFVETVGGDLTIKVEDNTEDGEGIYQEPVEDPNQGLDDATIHYAKVGVLILLKILPFAEQEWRYFVFNTRTHGVTRIDAIGMACVQLPEDHGIIFPGGYYLQSGENKVFEGDPSDLAFEKVIRSPNGEDVLYVFHHMIEGSYVLFPYNLITKAIQNPIHCHGWTLFDDGKMIVFKIVSNEPTRVHPVQFWKTPFTSAEFAAAAPTDGSFLAKIGNAELVRGISEALSIRRQISDQKATRELYEDLIAATTRSLDSFYWLGREEVGDIHGTLTAIRDNGELIIDEFEKVLSLRKRAREALAEASQAKIELERDLNPLNWRTIDPFMGALTSIRGQRGHLITLRELRYIDLESIATQEEELVEHFERISRAAIEFLLRDEALAPTTERLQGLLEQIEAVKKTPDLVPLSEDLEETSTGLNVLTEVVGGLEVDDPTNRTRVLEGISEVFGQLNRVRATLQSRKTELLGVEGKAEFGAQFRLLDQAVTSALSLADSPEACDEQLSRLMIQLEGLESRFSEFEAFQADLATKREEVYEAFDSKRQTLADERQRRAQNMLSAAQRILQGIGRRSKRFKTPDELNAYFASDAMVTKLRQLTEGLLEIGDSVKADEIASGLKSAKQDALRGLRDRLDLFDGGEDLLKLGRHRFNVNTRPLELTLLPTDEGMCLHLTGTDFKELVDDEAFEATRPFWDQHLVSETHDVYRGEYLAYCVFADAEAAQSGLTLEGLRQAALEEGGLLEVVRGVARERYDEGYERGLHDADATLILEALTSLYSTAGLLRFPPTPRAWACLFWAAEGDAELRASWQRRAQSLARLKATLGPSSAAEALAVELAEAIGAELEAQGIDRDDTDALHAGRYLVEELARETPRFATSRGADSLRQAFRSTLQSDGQLSTFDADLSALEGAGGQRFALAQAWLEGFRASASAGDAEDQRSAQWSAVVNEAAVLLLTDGTLDRDVSSAQTSTIVSGLLGQHRRIESRAMTLRVDEFLERLNTFRSAKVPAYREYRQRVRELLERERKRLRLEEFEPRVLTSFVRNRLINEVYLPLVGDNLAKQLGAAGDGKRTDLMGLLLLVSPPGYGKTTLMEYVASRLGLAFVKINGPSLGHSITSLDPSEASSATARQEVEKVNLALEMGNNVMLYLDDIQHTHPEFLQKFISLCDGQRRIEGVWKGRTRTYDLRGKKFCVIMAGNPYTESGEAFQIPDMLANRADTYNLGEVLDGKEHLFALSYVENAITSNAILAPLAGREQADIYRLIRLAQGEEVASIDFAFSYSAVELNEITTVLKHMFAAQDVLLKVNALYVSSASQDDAYRTEPPFKLQGSYRNMAKIAEKLAAAMNTEELERLISDHYQGEAQTLTTGAEQNLLKLAELRGIQSPEDAERWAEIKRGFARVQTMGGGEDDPVTRVTGQISSLGEKVTDLRDALVHVLGNQAEAPTADEQGSEDSNAAERSHALAQTALTRLDAIIETLAKPQLDVHVHHQETAAIAELLERQSTLLGEALRPLVVKAGENIQHGQAVVTRLAELVAEHYEYEKTRRVRLSGPTRRLKPDE